ncbi:MAG TPA: hypothetical protein VD846_09605 [Allosphingosinicella sp.]|nr:hypothetical protein [Allosphingosinicella sp.]
MIPAVQTALDAIVNNVTALTHAKGAGRAYELYIMTGIAEGLASAGCAVRVQRSDESFIAPTDADRRFIQRGGAPAGVAGKAQGPGNASSFVFQLPNSSRQWEIWNGIQFIGRSAALHEIDIAIVPREVGIALRGLPAGGSPTGRAKVSIECKDVGDPGSQDEMRTFVARLYDLTILNWHRAVAHLAHPLQAIYPGKPAGNGPYYSFWDGNRATFNVVARRSGFRSGSLAMTGYYGIQPRGPVVPGSSEDAALVHDLVVWIMSNLN